LYNIQLSKLAEIQIPTIYAMRFAIRATLVLHSVNKWICLFVIRLSGLAVIRVALLLESGGDYKDMQLTFANICGEKSW
jgi:hypothetical protein